MRSVDMKEVGIPAICRTRFCGQLHVCQGSGSLATNVCSKDEVVTKVMITTAGGIEEDVPFIHVCMCFFPQLSLRL